MSKRIEVYCDSYGVWYCGTRKQLINTGIATAAMFPASSESWRGNGMHRGPDEPLWSVQRTADDRFKVMWGLCTEQEQD